MKKPAPPKVQKFPAAKQRRLDKLLDKNSEGILPSGGAMQSICWTVSRGGVLHKMIQTLFSVVLSPFQPLMAKKGFGSVMIQTPPF
jgi:hypothetical protein